MARLLLRARLALALLLSFSPFQSAIASEEVEGLLAELPDAVIKRLKKPNRFMDETTALIMGYGTAGRIDVEGMRRFVEKVRSYLRARQLRKMLAADPDNDLAVSEDEIGVWTGAAGARSRGRLPLRFRAGDANRDKVLDFANVRRHAQEKALDGVSDAELSDMLDLLAFDADGDGFVSLDENVRRVPSLGYDV